MNWPGPILTDSGGFQVMSLAQLNKVSEDGVAFQSHIDGARYELTPERSIEIQDLLHATITMQLYVCVKLPADEKRVAEAMSSEVRRVGKECVSTSSSPLSPLHQKKKTSTT